MSRVPSALAAAALLLMAGACQREATPDPAAAPAAPAAQPAPAPPAAPDQTQPPPGVPVDAAEPRLKTVTLDGADYDLAGHRGKWVLLNFWATWCKPCVKEMPELSALDAMREHIEVLGLAYDDSDPKDIRAFLAEHPVSYPVAIVDMNDPPADFATPVGLPTTYLIGPDGKLAKKFMGPVTAKDIEAEIRKAGGPEPG